MSVHDKESNAFDAMQGTFGILDLQDEATGLIDTGENTLIDKPASKGVPEGILSSSEQEFFAAADILGEDIIDANSLGMDSLRIGIIGVGNMGGAIAESFCRHPAIHALCPVQIFDRNVARMLELQELGATPHDSPHSVINLSDVIFLAVKPDVLPGLLEVLSPYLSHETVLVSIAAGVTIEQLKEYSKEQCPLIRIMPNTLVRAGHGIFGMSLPDDSDSIAPSQKQKDQVVSLLSALGQVIEIDESKMNAFTALSGSGPAFVFHFMESLAEAGVRVGLGREASMQIAQKLLLGSATLAMQSGLHPAILREQVTSPGGTTVAGVNHMDRHALRGHMVDAVYAAYLRGVEMEKL